MKTKICFKCKCRKTLNEFYTHKKMKDGYLGKCKQCAKDDTQKHNIILRKNPLYYISERGRARNKYYRLYKGKIAVKYLQRYRREYSEKIKAYHFSKNIVIKKGNHRHHWSYRKEHWKDIIEISVPNHYKLHRYIIYDEERMMFRRIDSNLLLDTKKSHIKYMKSICPF